VSRHCNSNGRLRGDADVVARSVHVNRSPLSPVLACGASIDKDTLGSTNVNDADDVTAVVLTISELVTYTLTVVDVPCDDPDDGTYARNVTFTTSDDPADDSEFSTVPSRNVALVVDPTVDALAADAHDP
jgi:hypothetical protein